MPKRFGPASAGFLMAAYWFGIATVPLGSAADPVLKCQVSKLQLSRKYGACRLQTVSKALQAGVSPNFASCDGKLPSKWQSAEAKAGAGICPSEADQLSVQDFLTWCSEVVDEALRGGHLPGCTGPSFPLKTAQTTCYDGDGQQTAALHRVPPVGVPGFPPGAGRAASARTSDRRSSRGRACCSNTGEGVVACVLRMNVAPALSGA